MKISELDIHNCFYNNLYEDSILTGIYYEYEDGSTSALIFEDCYDLIYTYAKLTEQEYKDKLTGYVSEISDVISRLGGLERFIEVMESDIWDSDEDTEDKEYNQLSYHYCKDVIVKDKDGIEFNIGELKNYIISTVILHQTNLILNKILTNSCEETEITLELVNEYINIIVDEERGMASEFTLTDEGIVCELVESDNSKLISDQAYYDDQYMLLATEAANSLIYKSLYKLYLTEVFNCKQEVKFKTQSEFLKYTTQLMFKLWIENKTVDNLNDLIKPIKRTVRIRYSNLYIIKQNNNTTNADITQVEDIDKVLRKLRVLGIKYTKHFGEIGYEYYIVKHPDKIELISQYEFEIYE